MVRPLALGIAVSAALAGVAAADPQATGEPPSVGERCAEGSPGSPPCPGSDVRWTPPPPPESLASRTHLGLIPTGSTIPGGTVQFQNNELFWQRLGVGITDRLELSVDGVLIPDEGAVMAVGARLQITPPSSPFKLTGGAGLWGSASGGDDERIAQFTAIAGYHGEAASVYGSSSVLLSSESESDAVVLYALGVAARISPRSAITACLGRIADEDGGEAVHGTIVGWRYLGRKWDVDLGLLVAAYDSERLPPIPLVSFSYHD